MEDFENASRSSVAGLATARLSAAYSQRGLQSAQLGLGP